MTLNWSQRWWYNSHPQARRHMATEREYYEEYWRNPDEYHDPTTAARKELILQHAGLEPGQRILDAGCGIGEFSEWFNSKLNLESIGIDYSQAAIDHAQKLHHGAMFEQATPADMVDKYEGYFDAVFSSEVIEHLFDVDGYLQSIHALLRPGGTLILTTPFHGLVKNLAITMFGFERHFDPRGQHIRFFTRRTLSHCLEDHGFHIRVITGYGRPRPLWKSFFVIAAKD